MKHGFTNDAEIFDAVLAWKEAAIADGWEANPTYKLEPMESAARLTKEGFVVMILTRKKEGHHKWKFETSIHIWGPDGRAISPPAEYSWEFIQKGVHHCNYCGADGVKTNRVGFAGRCCDNCLADVRKKVEYPGWEK